MHRRLLTILLVLVLALGVFAVACAKEEATTSTAGGTETTAGTTETTAAATGEPIKIGFDEGFTSFMAYEAQNAEKGILTALAMVNNEVAGRPIEYIKADNESDPVKAVDMARKLVESDGIDFMCGPLFSPSARAVTAYLAGSSGIPQCSIAGQPSENLETANKLAFMPNGLYGSQGYYFGQYVAEQLGYKTVNCIYLDDTAAYEMQAGFERAFTEAGGTITSLNYVPMDMIDFSAYLSALDPADCTLFWVFGNGAVPFVQQYHDYGIEAPLISPMSTFGEDELAELGEIGLGMVACDYYAAELDNSLNEEFVAKYREMWNGEYPYPTPYGSWQAVMLFLEGVKKTNGDTTPAKVIEAMSTLSFDTPSGKVTMSPYKDAYVGTRDWFMLETQRVGDRITWVPIFTYEQVFLGE